MTNSLGFTLHYKNGSEYNISQTTPDNELEIWVDNRVQNKDLNFAKGGTTFPPIPMATFQVQIPKFSSLFLNVLHNVNSSRVEYNITNSTGHIIGVGIKEEILDTMLYLGLLHIFHLIECNK